MFFIISYSKSPAYKDSPPEAVLVNVLGLLIVAFGGLVLWIVTRPLLEEAKRRNRTNHEQ